MEKFPMTILRNTEVFVDEVHGFVEAAPNEDSIGTLSRTLKPTVPSK
jgi:hypothetical protein